MENNRLPELGAIVINITQIVLEILEEDEEDESNVIEKTDQFAEFTVTKFQDNQFKEHFRILQNTFENLLQKFHNSIEELHTIHSGHPELDIEKQILVTIWYLANLESFRSVSDRFGITKSTCWDIIQRTAKRFIRMSQIQNIIKFPTGDESANVIRGFQQVNGFPGILGAIDGCHIRIKKPIDSPNSYINRKGFSSILLQGICNHRKEFIDVYAGEPGSIHDSRLFTKSDISRRIMGGNLHFHHDNHLIGDLAYKLTTKLVVGFKNNGHLTDAQKNFNKKLSQCRIVIENTFGLLKGRFRRLIFVEATRLDLVALIVISACILHNVCLINDDFIEEIYEEENENNENDENNEGPPDAAAIAKRENICIFLAGNM